MRTKHRLAAILLLFGMLSVCLLTGCSVLQEAIEDAKKNVLDYDDGIKSLDNYENTTDLALFMSLPEMALNDCASDDFIDDQNHTDGFGNSERVCVLRALNQNHTGQILYASINLKYGVYNRDKLNCILKDVKALLEEYGDSCDKLLIVFRDSREFIEWYAKIDRIENESIAIVCRADYVSYIKEVYVPYISIKIASTIISVTFRWRSTTLTLTKRSDRMSSHRQTIKSSIKLRSHRILSTHLIIIRKALHSTIRSTLMKRKTN